jgi:DNA-binding IclR family transcriptional regulator
VAGATSNPTKRVVALLNFLARRPGRSYSLSDLSRELTISKSTLHPLVETLADAGYLMRDESSRLIRLGPVLTGIGAAALGHRGHMVDSLRPAMEELAHELDAHCLVSAVFDDWIVPIAAAGEPTRVTTLFRLGARANPFAPPLGLLFLAGKPMSEVQDWLDRAQPPMDPAEIELTLSAVDLLRSTGVAAASRLDVKARIEKALDDYTLVAEQPQLPDMMRELRRSHYALTDFAQPERVEVDWIGIPLCDDRGQVDSALVVLNLPDRRSGPEVLEIAARMRAAVADIPGVRPLAGTDGSTLVQATGRDIRRRAASG